MAHGYSPPLDLLELPRSVDPMTLQTAAAPAASDLVEAPAPALSAARPAFFLAVATLWQREVVRFLRQRNRVIGALATPIVFWLLLGSGLNQTFVVDAGGAGGSGGGAEGMGYLAYFFPGAMVMILLFTSIFSTITVIEDRREGFLQGVLVSPAPRLAIVLGKVLGGAALATLQALVFLALWPFVGTFPGWPAVLGCLVAAFGISAGLTALGLCLAWPMNSTAGYHAVMNLILMPMWFLSGSVFPVVTAPGWLKAVMYLNPLTYGHALLTATLLGREPATAVSGIPVFVAIIVVIGFCILAVAATVWVANRPRAGGA